MPDKKLTDNEIIKALEDWLNIIREDQQRCLKTGASYDVVEEMHGTYIDTLVNALDLINRQQAEIERLKKNEYICKECLDKTLQKE